MGRELNLFDQGPAGPDDGAWTVSRLTRQARSLVESGFRVVWVKGEVANFKRYRSGHWYFSLRDAGAQVRCVMWRDDTPRVKPPADGQQVFVEARPTVWEEKGEFRLTVRSLIATEDGGSWELELQRAREALHRDGLLDPARKRALPAYPVRIAVVTSPDGAAFRDILAVLRRRWPVVTVLLLPTLVQGDGAERQICAALARVNRVPNVDLVIVGRGGGSREDLWAFNRERVARALAAVRVPTISAVGHETDVSLTDLVADFQAPTPSAAAEAAVPDRSAALDTLDAIARHLASSLAGRTRFGLERLARTGDRLTVAMETLLDRGRHRLQRAGTTLDAVSPLRLLDRGFAVARDDSGRVLRRTGDFAAGDHFVLTVSDGDVSARVAETGDG